MRNGMSSEAIAFVKELKPGLVATVSTDGKAGLLHQGTLTVFDEDHLIFADLTSPQAVQNLQLNPALVVDVVDHFAGTGHRFRGKAQVIPVSEKAAKFISFYEKRGMAEAGNRIQNFVLIQVDSQEVVSPSVDCLPETERKNHGVSNSPHDKNFWRF